MNHGDDNLQRRFRQAEQSADGFGLSEGDFWTDYCEFCSDE
jgi:hypothetical protein